MQPHRNITVFYTPLATCWLEPETLCVVSNKEIRSVENLAHHYSILRGIVKKKMYWLLDLRTCQNWNMEIKAIIHAELPDLCKALAIILEKHCEKNTLDVFLELQSIGIPVEKFEDEQSARKWLKNVHP